MRNPKYGTKPEGRPDSSFQCGDFLEDENDFLRHPREEHNLISQRYQSKEKCIAPEISSAKTTCIIQYDIDETLEIKDEIIQDQEILREKFNKKHLSKVCSVHIREDDVLAVNKLQIHKKKKIQESKQELEKKFKCEKCARMYDRQGSLYNHQTYACNIMPQFICEFCSKRFKWKFHMKAHIDQLHQKTNSKTSKKKYNCDKCSRSYISISNLNKHKRLSHSVVKPQFICDRCGFKTNMKCILSNHIIARHLK